MLDLKKIKGVGRKVRRHLPALAVLLKGLSLLFSKRSYLKETGYLKSTITQMPCRNDGSPVPWMNYSVISFFEERLKKDHSLFEYGCGNSTLFFSKYVGSVISVECNPKWYEYVYSVIPDNVTLILHDPFENETYCKIATEQNRQFDVIVIDAEDRTNCLIHARQALTEKGVIILDDSQGESFSEEIHSLMQHGFKKLDFIGLKPASTRLAQTTVFYRQGNCLGI